MSRYEKISSREKQAPAGKLKGWGLKGRARAGHGAAYGKQVMLHPLPRQARAQPIAETKPFYLYEIRR